MQKCFILILGVFVSFEAQAQTIHTQMNRDLGTAARTTIRGESKDELYKIDGEKILDGRNQVIRPPQLTSFVAQKEQPKLQLFGKKKEETARYEANQKIKYTCRVPWKLQKHGEGKIQKIYSISAKKYVKVEGCSYLVESSLIAVVEEKLPQKQQVKSRAVAQRSAQ